MALRLLLLAGALAAVSMAASPALDYSSWHATTRLPFEVSLPQWTLCAPANPASAALGPHAHPGLKIYLNNSARSGLQKPDRPLPLGATIVKEKWPALDDKSPVAYTAMVKREADYDPKHGNWEYIYTELDGQRRSQRGRIASCIACHMSAAKTDYLFGKHLRESPTLADSPPKAANR